MNQLSLFASKRPAVSELRLTGRTTLRPGTRFKLRGGPIWTDAYGVKHRLGLRGLFEFRRAYVIRGRQYIDACRVEQGMCTSTHTLFIEGDPYAGPVASIVNYVYRVRKIRKQNA